MNVYKRIIKYLYQKTNPEEIKEKNPKENFSAPIKVMNNVDGKKLYVIDFENVGVIPRDIARDKNSVALVFVGNQQNKSVKAKHALIDSSNCYFIYLDRTKKNYLDNYLSCYVGAILSKYTPESIKIVSKDRDFEALIDATKVLGYKNIEYYDLSANKIKFDEKQVKMQVKDTFILLGNFTKLAEFRRALKKRHTEWTADDLNEFISQAKKLEYIRFNKINQTTYVFSNL